MSEFWHKLGCCVVEKPQPQQKRRRIDRTMIGEPMNFVHLTHIGSGEMGAGDGLAMTGALQQEWFCCLKPPLCVQPRRDAVPTTSLLEPVVPGSLFPVSLIVPQKAWGLDSLCSRWL
ncbi:Cdc42 Small Effector Protein 1 [Manis pentadactyla]|nr:Cdc42 Small Effector Protein 1 [Manis pentadactyla]